MQMAFPVLIGHASPIGRYNAKCPKGPEMAVLRNWVICEYGIHEIA